MGDPRLHAGGLEQLADEVLELCRGEVQQIGAAAAGGDLHLDEPVRGQVELGHWTDGFEVERVRGTRSR
jgi:hypothetical protein